MNVSEEGRVDSGCAVMRAWLHLAVLLILAGFVQAVSTSQGPGAGEGWVGRWLGSLPAFLYGIVPILSAISIAMFRFCRNTPRLTLIMVATVTVIMVGLDLVTGGGTGGNAAVGFQPGGVVSATHGSDYTGVSMISVVRLWIRGDLSLPTLRSTTYHEGDPWVLVGFATAKLGALALPLLLAGVVVGVQGWIKDHVTFRRPVDATAAQVTITWFLAPGIFYLVRSWTLKLTYQVLFSDTSLLVLLLPLAVLAVPAAVGWVTSVRVARWLE